MQTPVDDFGIFTEVSRSTQASPSARWSPSQGIPHKGQALGRVNPWIALGLLHVQVGLRCAFRQASPGPLPAVFTIKLLTKMPRALFPLVGVISQDYVPLRCTTMMRTSTEW